MLIILTAIIFYYIGKYSRTDKEKQVVNKYVRKLKTKSQPGVLPFKTPEELELERNGDKALEQEWIKSGKLKQINEM